MDVRYVSKVNNRRTTGSTPSEAGTPAERSGNITNHNIEKNF